jgi:hypothetical protein
MLSLEDTSPRELLGKVHSKSQRKSILLLPSLRQKVEKQNEGGAVSLLDLEHILKTSSRLIVLEAASEGWEMTLLGSNIEGTEDLLVSVYLPRKEGDPLQIRDFGSMRKSFMNLVETLSSEEQITTQEFIKHLRQNTPASGGTFHAVLDSFVRAHQELLHKLAH